MKIYHLKTADGFKVWTENYEHMAGFGASLFDAAQAHKAELDTRREEIHREWFVIEKALDACKQLIYANG